MVFFVSQRNIQGQNKNKYDEVTLSANIHCVSCQKKIESKLPYEMGIIDMKVDVSKKQIWIKYNNTKTDKKKILETLEKMGFPAKEIQSKNS